ncbi:hypothetical protein GW17_00000926 [Ensete ventricosum]|nr:hypothetical protein GW17_00000926 [Ensete ventricosum]
MPVRQVIGMRTTRYRAVPPKIDRPWPIEEEIDRRRSIEREIDRRRSIEEEKGKKKRKRRKKEEEKIIPRLRAVAARARGCLSPARGDGASPRTGRKIEATSDLCIIDCALVVSSTTYGTSEGQSTEFWNRENEDSYLDEEISNSEGNTSIRG